MPEETSNISTSLIWTVSVISFSFDLSSGISICVSIRISVDFVGRDQDKPKYLTPPFGSDRLENKGGVRYLGMIWPDRAGPPTTRSPSRSALPPSRSALSPSRSALSPSRSALSPSRSAH